MKRIDFDTIDSTNEEAKRRIRGSRVAARDDRGAARDDGGAARDDGGAARDDRGAAWDDRVAARDDSTVDDTIFDTVITARAQTAGKGRRGRDFFSPGTGDSVYASFILRPPAGPESIQLLTIAAAVAVCRTIEEAAAIGRKLPDPGSAPGMTRPAPGMTRPAPGMTGTAPRMTGAALGMTGSAPGTTGAAPGMTGGHHVPRPVIKWVNDILIENKKVCGILAEGVLATASSDRPVTSPDASGLVTSHNASGLAAIILGIGVNITVPIEDFPPELRGTAGSLWLPTGAREGFVQLLCKQVLEACAQAGTGEGDGDGAATGDNDGAATGTDALLRAYRAYENTTGRRVLVMRHAEAGAVSAYAKAIADDGGLVVVYADGSEETLRSGEVSILPQA
jgi:biotin-(acetyl-CoA carboxylase) ligase